MKIKLLAACAVVMCAMFAHADTMTLTVWDGTTLVSAAPVTCTTNCAIALSGTDGVWNFILQSGLLQSGPANPLSTMDVGGSARSGAAGSLTIDLTVSGITSPVGPNGYLLTSTANNGSGTTQLFSIFENATLSSTSGTVLSGTLIPSPISGTGSASGTFSFGPSPYSLTEQVVLTANGAANFSNDSRLTIPEPASLGLLGGGFLALAGVARRRLTKQ